MADATSSCGRSGPMGFSVDDQVQRVVLEAVECALGQQRVVEGGNPLRDVAMLPVSRPSSNAGHHYRSDEELVDVAALLSRPITQARRKVIQTGQHIYPSYVVISASRSCPSGSVRQTPQQRTSARLKQTW